MGKRKNPGGLGGYPGVLGCLNCEVRLDHRSSTPLGIAQRIAADFRTGFHLEVGEFTKRRIYPSTRLEGTANA